MIKIVDIIFLIILEVLNGSVLMHLTFLERKRLIIKK